MEVPGATIGFIEAGAPKPARSKQATPKN